jgi:hypothetical protein
MAESDEIDRLLADAGAGWRARQPEPRQVTAEMFPEGRAPRFELARGGRAWAFVAGVASALALVTAVAVLAPGFLLRIGRPGGPATTAVTGGGYLPAGLASCPLTRPDPGFVPPPSYDGQPAAQWGNGWFGTNDLWTAVAPDGDRWIGLTKGDAGYSQKTFWWSDDFRVNREQVPQIFVTGRRLDGPGAFGFGPGTNAGGSDIGSAMLVGVDVPTIGCWEITARYRSAELSIVVWVG